jgi:Methane oxygenase PmoA
MKLQQRTTAHRSAELRSGALLLCLAVGSLGCTSFAASSTNNSGVQITQLPNSLRVEINGRLFTEYHFKDVSKPYCYPLIGPTGAGMTRDWPMKDTPGEEHDHPHHQGLWFGHQIVNGYNFWTVAPTSGKIVQESLVVATSGKDSGSITTQNKWVATNGAIILRDERTLRFYNRASDRIMDFEITLKATEDDVTFGDDKDGMMAIRVAETMRVLKPVAKGEKPKPGDGHIVLSTGVSDDGESAAAAKAAKREAITWGKRADWCDYYGPVDGKTVGVAIFDHPSNPRHPTWWHVRDYGLFAANPFGQSHFENLPDAGKGNLKLSKGQSLTFRYRFYFHEGDEEQANVAGRYKEYVQSSAESAK